MHVDHLTPFEQGFVLGGLIVGCLTLLLVIIAVGLVLEARR